MPNTNRIFFNISNLDLAWIRHQIKAWRTNQIVRYEPVRQWPEDEWFQQLSQGIDWNVWKGDGSNEPGQRHVTAYPIVPDPAHPGKFMTETNYGSEVDVVHLLGDTSSYLWPRLARLVAQRLAHMGGQPNLRHTYLFVENGRPRFYRQMQESGLPDAASFVRVAKLIERYQRYCHYCEEIEPEWKDVGLLHFADNSTEMEQVDKRGRKRRVMVTAPHGDACF